MRCLTEGGGELGGALSQCVLLMRSLTAARASVVVTHLAAREGLRRWDSSSPPSNSSIMWCLRPLLPRDLADACFLLTNLTEDTAASPDTFAPAPSLADLLKANTVIDARKASPVECELVVTVSVFVGLTSCPPYFNMLQREGCRLLIPRL